MTNSQIVCIILMFNVQCKIDYNADLVGTLKQQSTE